MLSIMNKTKKQELIEALINERNIMAEYYGPDPDYDYSIEYLRTGRVPEGVEANNYSLLDACVNELEWLYKKYEIQDG